MLITCPALDMSSRLLTGGEEVVLELLGVVVVMVVGLVGEVSL